MVNVVLGSVGVPPMTNRCSSLTPAAPLTALDTSKVPASSTNTFPLAPLSVRLATEISLPLPLLTTSPLSTVRLPAPLTTMVPLASRTALADTAPPTTSLVVNRTFVVLVDPPKVVPKLPKPINPAVVAL